MPDNSEFTNRFGLLELVISELSTEFQPTIERIRAEIGLSTMSNPQENSSGFERTNTNEFRVVRRDTQEEASVDSSGAPLGDLVLVGPGDAPSNEEGDQPLEA